VLRFTGDFMRALALLLLGSFGVLAVAANASSLVELKPLISSTSPSVRVLDTPGTPVTLTPFPAKSRGPNVAIGEVDPPHQRPDPVVGSIDTLSPSMVAIGEPAVVDEKVGAIDHTPHTARTTMVIRGGEIGSAFSAPQPAAKASPGQRSSGPLANARPPYPYPVKLPKPAQPSPVKATTPPEPAPEAADSPPAESKRDLQKPR
jgi:hypothetical protein